MLTLLRRAATSLWESWRPTGGQDALLWWAILHVAALVFTVVAPPLLTPGLAPSFLDAWNHWDAKHFQSIAVLGYSGSDPIDVAFFPGYPAALAALFWAGVPSIAAGLLVTAAASAVLAVQMAKLGSWYATCRGDAPEVAKRAGTVTAVLLIISPYAVFLYAGYSEALFLAFALLAWNASVRYRWLPAFAWTAAACLVRVNGVFLAAALMVAVLAGLRARTSRVRDLGWVVLPVAAVGAYLTYLYALTGSWSAWMDAQRDGWARYFVGPVESFTTTVKIVLGVLGFPPGYEWAAVADIVAAAVGVIVVGLLAVRRDWPGVTYLTLTLAPLLTSTYYMSVARSSLLWIPMWLLLGRALTWKRNRLYVWLGLTVPITVLVFGGFLAGRWLG